MRAQEKRGFPRVPVTLTAHCRIGNRFVREALSDLSEGGFYLRTRERAMEGTPVRIALALPSDDGPRVITLVGRVVRIDRDARGFAKGLGVSLSGTEIEPTDRASLSGFIGSSRALGLAPQVSRRSRI